MPMETYDKAELLQALDEVEARIAGIRFILERANCEPIEVDSDELNNVAMKAIRVSKKKGC